MTETQTETETETEKTNGTNGAHGANEAATVQVPGRHLIEVSEADQEMLGSCVNQLMGAEAALGAIRAEYLQRESEILKKIYEGRKEYANLIRAYARRYIAPGQPGQYDYNPNIGAFVLITTPQPPK